MITEDQKTAALADLTRWTKNIVRGGKTTVDIMGLDPTTEETIRALLQPAPTERALDRCLVCKIGTLRLNHDAEPYDMGFYNEWHECDNCGKHSKCLSRPQAPIIGPDDTNNYGTWGQAPVNQAVDLSQIKKDYLVYAEDRDGETVDWKGRFVQGAWDMADYLASRNMISVADNSQKQPETLVATGRITDVEILKLDAAKAFSKQFRCAPAGINETTEINWLIEYLSTRNLLQFNSQLTPRDDIYRKLFGTKMPGQDEQGGFIRSLCYTVWKMCHEPKHKDGNTDWFNDTLPVVNEGVEKIRNILGATKLSEIVGE